MLTLIVNELISRNISFEIEEMDFCECIILSDSDFIIVIDHDVTTEPWIEQEVDGRMKEICFGEAAVLKFIEGLA